MTVKARSLDRRRPGNGAAPLPASECCSSSRRCDGSGRGVRRAKILTHFDANSAYPKQERQSETGQRPPSRCSTSSPPTDGRTGRTSSAGPTAGRPSSTCSPFTTVRASPTISNLTNKPPRPLTHEIGHTPRRVGAMAEDKRRRGSAEQPDRQPNDGDFSKRGGRIPEGTPQRPREIQKNPPIPPPAPSDED